MPRLLPSKGNIIFKTVVPDEFQRYLCYELYNSQRWNPDTQSGGLQARGWEFKFTSKNEPKYNWKISWSRLTNQVEVISSQPIVWIRKGLYFRMGKGELIIEGHTP